MRKLATIQVIDEIKPHLNADALEIAMIKGWQVVVRKGEYKTGDTVIYFEIDSFLPVAECFEFLRKSSFKVSQLLGEGFKLRTIKLRGELSQGLIIHVEDIEEEFGALDTFEIGTDVSDHIGVVKWEVPIPACLQGKVKGLMPNFIRKTDLDRIQNVYDDIIKSNIKKWYIEEKLDGTSCTIYCNNGEVGVCGRNSEFELTDDTNTLVRVAKSQGILDVLKQYGRNIALQGEVIGPGIQGNHYGLNDHKFCLFDIFDIDRQEYLSFPEIVIVEIDLFDISYKVEFNRVPILDDIEYVKSLAYIIDYADGPSAINERKLREGVVFKTLQQDDARLRFKSVSNKFLLKNN